MVTVEEILRGRLRPWPARDGRTTILSYGLLQETILDFTQFPNVPYDQAAEDEFQQLRSIRIGTRDLKIASIALANRLIVVTRNRRDFRACPASRSRTGRFDYARDDRRAEPRASPMLRSRGGQRIRKFAVLSPNAILRSR